MSTNHIRNALERAHGRWRDILLAAGLKPKQLTGKEGPCPMCGGEDRFVYDNRKGCGDYICRQCGAGDGIQLLQRFRQWTHRQAFQHIESVAGRAPSEPARHVYEAPRMVKRQTTPEQFRAMSALWGRGKPTTVGDIAGVWLASRSIGLSPRVQNLRTLDQGRHAEMLARVDNVDGVAVQVHRTIILDPELEPGSYERRLMPGVHPEGSAVRLYEGGKVLGIAEGIENALAAACMFQIPVWAALNAGRLAKFDPPGYVERLEVFGDEDEVNADQYGKLTGGAGQCAAAQLVERMEARGIAVKAHAPPGVGCDWNDLLGQTMNGAGEFRAQ
jgi:putative DNA primase/helicase